VAGLLGFAGSAASPHAQGLSVCCDPRSGLQPLRHINLLHVTIDHLFVSIHAAPLGCCDFQGPDLDNALLEVSIHRSTFGVLRLPICKLLVQSKRQPCLRAATLVSPFKRPSLQRKMSKNLRRKDLQPASVPGAAAQHARGQ
jgi:hypothetical protein